GLRGKCDSQLCPAPVSTRKGSPHRVRGRKHPGSARRGPRWFRPRLPACEGRGTCRLEIAGTFAKLPGCSPAGKRPPADPRLFTPVPEEIAQIAEPTAATPIPVETNGQGPAPAAVATAHSMIVFEGVTKIYEPNVAALSEVSFVIDKGEFVVVVGASGSGKSTVIRLLLKELDPTSGRIFVAGRDLGRLPRRKVSQLRRNVACVFQDFKLLPNRTTAENVAYALKVQGENTDSIRRKVPEVLNLVGLAHKMSSYPDELSGGE